MANHSFIKIAVLILISLSINAFAENKINDLERIKKEKIRFEIHEIINAVQENRPISTSAIIMKESKFLSEDGAVSKSTFPESEVHAAINPIDSNNIIVSPIRQNINNPSNAITCPIYYTNDQGNTWFESQFITSPHKDEIMMAGGGDPVIAFDKNGRAYLSWIMLGIEMAGSQQIDSAFTAIYWAYSDDGGATWTRSENDRIFYKAAKGTFYSYFNPVIDLGSMADKQWMAVDLSNGEFNNSLYTTYVKLDIDVNSGTQNFNMYLANKRAGNNYFDDEKVLFSKGTYDIVQFGSLDVDANGHIHVTFFGGKNEELALYHNVSTDGGKSFGNESLISNFIFIGGQFSSGQDSIIGISTTRLYPSPYMAIDKRIGKSNVYIAWTADGITKNELNGKDIYFARSTNNGLSWETPIRVNDDEKSKLISNFYPNINVNPDGKVIVTWYDRRADQSDIETHHFMAVSNDYGETFSFNKQLTSQASDFRFIGKRNSEFGIGEYNAVVSTSGYAFPVWAEDRSGNGDVRVYFAKVDYDPENVSSVESVRDISNDLIINNVFPNPANSILNLDLSIKKPINLKIFITDIQGNLISELLNNNISGQQNLSFDVSKFAQGSYYLYFDYDNSYAIQRINIIR